MESLPGYDDWKLASGPPAGPHEMELDAQLDGLCAHAGQVAEVEAATYSEGRYHLSFRGDMLPEDVEELIDIRLAQIRRRKHGR